MTKPVLTLALGLSLCSTALSQHKSYIQFDGVGQYLSIPSDASLDIPLGQSRTITFWMWADRSMIYSESMRILSRRDLDKADSLNQSGYEITAVRTTLELLGANLPDGAGKFGSSMEGWGKLAQGVAHIYEWHHCALVIDRAQSSIKLYVNGSPILENTKDVRAWMASNNLPLFIGAGQRSGKPSGFFMGRLDNLRFYKRALSTEELKADRERERIEPKTEDLIFGFDFDNYKSGDAIVTDVTGRYTATLHGYPTALDHSLVRSYSERKTNASLIGRGSAQALRTLQFGVKEASQLKELELKTSETAERDVKSFKIYMTESNDRFDHRNPGTLLAEGRPRNGRAVLKIVPKAPKIDQNSKLWLVADISSSAPEGSKLRTQLLSAQLGESQRFTPKSIETEHEIVLERTLIWTPGEKKVASYRIPSIVRLDNGNLVVAADRRKNTDFDLPSDIDVEVKISKDNGRTWSEPITVAKGTPEYGFGDAAMVSDGKNIYMVMVGGSGLWFYPERAKKPLDMYFSMSSDGGRTWTPVKDITKQVYTDRYPNGGFFGSGNGIITSRGRIAFVAAMRIDSRWGGQMDNVMVYSDDLGKTWQASAVARTNGDEAKILELTNGDLLISSRNRSQFTARTYVTSSDHGETWSTLKIWEELKGNNCNAALTRYSRASEGKGQRDIIFHTLLASPRRENMRIYMSEDEGKTWPWANTICTGEAAYSEVVRLKDGTIGIISEEDDRPAYDIYFTRVSLDWIRKGGGVPITK